MSRIIEFRALYPQRPSIQPEVLSELELHGAAAVRALLVADAGLRRDRPLHGDQILLGNANALRSEIQDWLKWKAEQEALWTKGSCDCCNRGRVFLLGGTTQVKTPQLLSVAPENMGEDERVIAKHYRDWFGWIAPVIPLATANFLEQK